MKHHTRPRTLVVALVLSTSLVGAATAGAGISQTFADVSPAHPFHAEIEQFAAAGISTGYADSTYRPGAPVTRQAMAAFLVRGLGSVATNHRTATGPFGAATGTTTINQRPSTLPWGPESTQRVIVRGTVDWATESTRATVCPTPGPGCGFQLAIRHGGVVRGTSNTRISGDWDGGTAVVEAVFEVFGTNSFDPLLTLTPSPGVGAGRLYVLQSNLTVQTVPFGLSQGRPS